MLREVIGSISGKFNIVFGKLKYFYREKLTNLRDLNYGKGN